jgi:hypothetical protein
MSDNLVPPPNSGILPEDWQQTPESVRVWITVLGKEIKHLKDTVEKLQDIVNRNSGNSSQPPSGTGTGNVRQIEEHSRGRPPRRLL